MLNTCTNIFFGHEKTGKTYELMQSLKSLLQANPDMTHTVLGKNDGEEYSLEGHTIQPITVKNKRFIYEFITNADIVILPASRPIDFIFLSILINAGKYVFCETPSKDFEKSRETIQAWQELSEEELKHDKLKSPLALALFNEFPHINIENYLDDETMSSLVLEDESVNIYECENAALYPNHMPIYFISQVK